ncbi:MAG: hypothetical protein ACRENT_08230, partial [Thermodesulfobacteriota bacterium]
MIKKSEQFPKIFKPRATTVRYIIFYTLTILSAITLLAPLSNAGSGENSVPGIKKEATAKLADARQAYINYYKDSMNLNRSISILENITQNDPSNLHALLL